MTHNFAIQLQALENTIKKWDLIGKVVAVVTDNGSNVVKAIDLLRVRRNSCFAHTLNLLVTNALNCEEVKSVIEHAKEIVNIFRKSILAAETLKEVQKDLNMAQLKIVQDVCTRWNSLYYCLNRLLQNNLAVEVALVRLGKSITALSQSETGILKELCTLLEPFEEATKLTSGEKYVTSSIIIPTVDGLFRKLHDLERTIETPEVLAVLIELKRQFFNRLFPYKSNQMLKMATILDPRLKLDGFEENQSTSAKDLLVEKLTGIINASKAKDQKTINIPENDQSENAIGLLSHVEKRRAKSTNITSATASAIIIVQQYLQSRALSMEDSVFEYWDKYPVTELQYLAKKFLCIPATSVPSERVWSSAGQIMTDRRCRLKPENMDKQLFINSNL